MLCYSELFKNQIFDVVRHGVKYYSSSVHYLLYNVGSSVRIKCSSNDLGYVLSQFELFKDSFESLRVVSFNYNLNQVL